MTGHTFVYNSAVRYVKKLIDSGELGELRYIYSQRLNLGRIRSDIDALWNFAPHDISIIQYWLGDPEPISIGRQGMAYMQEGIDDVVFLNLEYPGKDHRKHPRQLVGSAEGAKDDHRRFSQDGGLRRHRGEQASLFTTKESIAAPFLVRTWTSITRQVSQFNYRSGDILMPQVKFAEPLRVEAEHFVDCIRNSREPLTGLDTRGRSFRFSSVRAR